MTNLEINAAYIGSTEVTHMYLGDELVWRERTFWTVNGQDDSWCTDKENQVHGWEQPGNNTIIETFIKKRG